MRTGAPPVGRCPLLFLPAAAGRVIETGCAAVWPPAIERRQTCSVCWNPTGPGVNFRPGKPNRPAVTGDILVSPGDGCGLRFRGVLGHGQFYFPGPEQAIFLSGRSAVTKGKSAFRGQPPKRGLGTPKNVTVRESGRAYARQSRRMARGG